MTGHPRLHRTSKSPVAPTRIVHIGLGAFTRAHQGYYTHRANQANPQDPWGIAAFTGRSPKAAIQLSRQHGLYHLITRTAEDDRAELITSLSSAHDGSDAAQVSGAIAAASTALITITVSEGGYHLNQVGRLDITDSAVAKDMAELAALVRVPDARILDAVASASITTMPGRIVLGLERRRRSQAGPLTIVPCDNLSANGATTRSVIAVLAGRVSPELQDWIASHVSFVTTSVDRITPATTPTDVATTHRLTAVHDEAPVVTEPFHDWVLSGAFTAGRPDWGRCGARFVTKIEPFEQRKLWLLNGAHSLLAYAGQLAGYQTVADAIRDSQLLGWIEQFWDEAARGLPATELGLDQYRKDLLARFENPRIEHHLAQIAAEGTTKIRLRAVPVLLSERDRGGDASAAARVVAAWIGWLLTTDNAPVDAAREHLDDARRKSSRTDPRPLLALLDARLADDDAIAMQVRAGLDQVLQSRGRVSA